MVFIRLIALRRAAPQDQAGETRRIL